MTKAPKILYFDIETSFCLAAVWGTGKQYVTIDQILKEWKILTISYMWDTDKLPTNLTISLDGHHPMAYDDDGDKEMIVTFMKVYEQADLVIAHNGLRFDLAKLKARLSKYGLPAIAPVIFDDTYIASKQIAFTSHKLDYFGKYFSVGRKIETKFRLWVEVAHEKSESALKTMSKYCGQDVVLLRKVFRKLKPYIKSKLNLASWNRDENCCPSCGAATLTKHGFHRTTVGLFQRFRCRSCGSTCRSGQGLTYGTGRLPRAD